jgi:hypothetical protein
VALGQKVELDVADGDPITVTYSAVDLRRYESQFHKSVLIEPMSLTMLTYLGWSAAKRQGLLGGRYAKWVDFDAVCTGVKTIPDEVEDGESPDPPQGDTPPTASDE